MIVTSHSKSIKVVELSVKCVCQFSASVLKLQASHTSLRKHIVSNRGSVASLSRLYSLTVCLRRRWMAHSGDQLHPTSGGQLTVGQRVTCGAVSQQRQRARLSEKFLQGTPCIGKCTVSVWPCTGAFRTTKVRDLSQD